MKQLLAAIMLFILWPAMSMAKPQISLPETHFDFGNVPQNSVLTHGYLIRNIGDDTLKIIEVRPG